MRKVVYHQKKRSKTWQCSFENDKNSRTGCALIRTNAMQTTQQSTKWTFEAFPSARTIKKKVQGIQSSHHRRNLPGANKHLKLEQWRTHTHTHTQTHTHEPFLDVGVFLWRKVKVQSEDSRLADDDIPTVGPNVFLDVLKFLDRNLQFFCYFGFQTEEDGNKNIQSEPHH